MTADLRLVVDTAQRDACETPPEGAGNRFPQRGLADAWWANQGDDCARAAASHRLQVTALTPLLYRQELDDPLFDVVQSGMVRIEDAACLGHIEAVFGFLAPRQLEHPIQVIADPALLRVLFAGTLEAVQLSLDFFAHVVGERRIVDLLAIV